MKNPSIPHLHQGASVYEHIRRDILYGELQPGSRLKLESLKARYEVGINTLRETLARLSSEGLVEAEEQKGFRVVATDSDNLRELTAMRLLLETEGARLSIEAGDVEWEGRLVAAHHKLSHIEQLMMKDQSAHVMDWTRYDMEFHQALISGCGSALHMRLHREIFDQFRRYVVIELKTSGFRGQELVNEHRAIAEAALAHDFPRCAEALALHIGTYHRRGESEAR